MDLGSFEQSLGNDGTPEGLSNALDDANAAYWYRRAGQPFPTASLADEWRAMAAALLA